MTASSSTTFISQAVHLENTANARGDNPAYWVKNGADWHPTSWHTYYENMISCAKSLIAMGITKGDRLCILSYNRPEWIIICNAALSIGAVPVGIYWTASAQDIEYIVKHSDSKLLFIENKEHQNKVTSIQDQCPALQKIILIDGDAKENTLPWGGFHSKGANITIENFHEKRAQIKPTDQGMLIYTSGTTGPPKAVILSQDALTSAATAVIGMFHPTPEDRLISYLPMAHVAEQNGMIHQHAQIGFQIYFSRSIEEMAEHLQEVRPTVHFGVPRLFEKMSAAIKDKIEHSSNLTKSIFQWATKVTRKAELAKLKGDQLSPFLSLQASFAERFIIRKVKSAVGLDQARLILCGAAPVSEEILYFFAGLGLPIREVYGQSETSGPATVNTLTHTRLGSVGRPPMGFEIKIEADGEVLIKAPSRFSGYDKDEVATTQTLDGDYVRSGDIGHLDDDGYLYITGRKKDLIITSGGKNISPGYIEADLMDVPIIEHAVIFGDNKNYLTALITLDDEKIASLSQFKRMEAEDVYESEALYTLVEKEVHAVNTRHSRVEHIRRFKVLNTTFTIDTGELTPTLKVRRATVIDKYQVEFEAMYQEN